MKIKTILVTGQVGNNMEYKCQLNDFREKFENFLESNNLKYDLRFDNEHKMYYYKETEYMFMFYLRSYFNGYNDRKIGVLYE